MGRGGTGWEDTRFMHGRSRITTNLSRTEHIWPSPTRQTMLAPNAEHLEVFGESHSGCTIQRTTRQANFGIVCVLSRR